MISSQGIREMTGEYVWIQGAQESYLQNRRGVVKNRYWEAGMDFLEWAMVRSWWE